MSKEVKRYDPDSNGNMHEWPDGDYVSWDDYDALRTELAEANADFVRIANERESLLAERDSLQEEVTEMDDLRDKLSGLLSKTAVALRGPEPELTRYGYADIPLRVKTVIDGRDQLRAEVEGLRSDAERLDRLDLECEGYGCEGVHEGNRWMIDGPFRTVRDAIDAAMAAKEGV